MISKPRLVIDDAWCVQVNTMQRRVIGGGQLVGDGAWCVHVNTVGRRVISGGQFVGDGVSVFM